MAKTAEEKRLAAGVKPRNQMDKKKLKHLEFLNDMYHRGIPLPPKDLKKLLDNEYIQIEKKLKEELPAGIEIPSADYVSKSKTLQERETDSKVDIIHETDDFMLEDDEDTIIVNQKIYSDITGDARYIYSGSKKITKDDWYPKDRIYHTPEFVEWIDSINSGFQKMVPYKPFQMYCQQALDWMADKTSIYDLDTEDERREFVFSEMDRIKENSLYFLDKYLKVKEAIDESGSMQYESKPVHKVMAFMMDCGYSVEMGKGRQIAATTTLGGLAICKMIGTKNYFIKMIAQDKEKVQEIFDDKIKYPFSELPEWLHQPVLNDRDNLLYIGSKETKGRKNGVNSKILVVPPTVGAINGGAPPLVLIDEGGYIGILGKMIRQARPTMFVQDQRTKKITMKRQIWIWGTGGEMDKGGKAYEEELRNTFDKWQKRDFGYGIIPLFFDWTTRPGITKEHYLMEKRNAMRSGPEAEAAMVEFHQTYPSIVEHMFLTSHKTLISINTINDMTEKIRSLHHDLRAEKGYFMPIFDETRPSDEHDELPFKVVGATWVPCNDNDTRATTTIFMHPKERWIDRYFMGTDPIQNDNGYSKMASAIWDAQFNTLAAVTNYRVPDHKETYLQCMLLGLYYKAKPGESVPDLVESNLGNTYCDYKTYRGYGRDLVLRTELPSHLQGGQNEIGIDNRGKRNSFIINKMHELAEFYGENIYIEDFWGQLRYFVCKVTAAGNETWGTQDTKKYFDDVLFAAVFAYICSICYTHRPPKNIDREQDMVKIRFELQRGPDGMLKRVPTRKRAA